MLFIYVHLIVIKCPKLKQSWARLQNGDFFNFLELTQKTMGLLMK